jgi:prephenate dehydrogenase
MWRDICLANGEAIQLLIDRFIEDLQALSHCVHEHDGVRLLELFESAKQVRDAFVEK